jgi:hypothetical protein
MCCFSRPVQSVSATKIFARPAENGRQYLVYSMTLRAKEELAMVLPLPVQAGSGEKALEFIDLKIYPGFFADLRKGFPAPLPPPTKARALGDPPEPKEKLEVVSVGSFEASFVPTVADFARLDERFRLPPGTWEKLPTYRDHGFAVFKLKAGESKVHPMAFSFPRARPGELFFPTVHIHDGKVHDRAKFDHVLFCQRGAEETFNLLDWDESTRHAGAFMQLDKARSVIDGGGHCYRRTLTGTLPNKDFILGAA